MLTRLLDMQRPAALRNALLVDQQVFMQAALRPDLNCLQAAAALLERPN